MVSPPSTVIIWPVMYEAAGTQRKATTDETSFASPNLFIGVRSWHSLSNSLLAPITYVNIGKMKLAKTILVNEETRSKQGKTSVITLTCV